MPGNKNGRPTSPIKSNPGSLRRKNSRILGQPSQSSLYSSYTKDREELKPKVTEEQTSTPITDTPTDTTTDTTTDTPTSTPNPETNTTQSRGKNWSIWPRRSIYTSDDSRPTSKQSATINNDTSAASIKSEKSSKSTVQETQQQQQAEETNSSTPTPTPTPNIEVPDESKISRSPTKEVERNWMSWRKPSLTSLKKAAATESDTELSTSQPKAIETKDSNNSSKTKDDFIDPNLKKNERTSSWSFWNSSNSELKSKTSNVLLSSEDAVLFESNEATENDKQKAIASKKLSSKPHIPNQVVPVFETLPYYSTTTSVINNFNNLKYQFGFKVEDPKHLYRLSSRSNNDIKKVLIIGVHGFFPTKVLRPLIGEPTGTSIKFAKEAEKSILRWAERENLNISIQKIALEKEGKIFDRVEFFYNVMKKWEKDIQTADYIYIAAHSQGSPVSILLLSRLIEDGIIDLNKTKKISLLAMAGINNGPFYGVDQKLFVRAYSTIENDSLMELFQFQNFNSVHSKDFIDSLKNIVNNNVKITFIGSINDQLVPLYSSTCLHVRHPNLFRATYIDGSSQTPNFVSKAVSLSNHLHNIGKSDHGVIKEISNSLAGPLTGGGHSKIYNDPQVYDLALNFSLYTNDLKYQIPLHFKPYSIETLGMNPYHLPWCMRGLLFETKIHIPNGDEEIDELFKEFENWKPETKQLKDMKYRLNGIKSKL
ncbi:hypothetical protein BN7_360 [Wickerhamomyces ciferrii]|uniref:YMC020W-like alpha/beta hydrolase domain-containing protein n=1 Tax=Wickerhamomyces ciferrii (strain ATCC 14091 / BCRC 22168 / CBS 111 / JCM 3599 / NBRC 0793 / NRRL Y-1031 F-60-10) TaxID=1206466 RepID=K0KD63_WICCF|nr:uncharacterized protein BN7_360 [Wickerhamomyces ciferrii]CCH40826.1 hypothetical protein BN7_360 [Wickerhamomyces ciferrii]